MAVPVSQASNQVVVVLKAGTDPYLYAWGQGLEFVSSFQSVPNAYVLRAESPSVAVALRPSGRAMAIYPNPIVRRTKHGFTPNDPYYPDQSPTADWPGQWYLRNTAVNGINMNGPWSQDLTGSGIIVGIIDDGFAMSHPDLAGGFSGSNSYDFGQSDSNPSPVFEDDVHGTAVAGILGARGSNQVGITGAAPRASMAGLRCDMFAGAASSFADATLYHSSGANTNIKIKVHSYGVNDTFVDQSLESDALATSTAAGTIHIFSAGNERGAVAEDCAKQMLQGSPNALVVAGLSKTGVFSDYSSFGSNVFCTAPSGSTLDSPVVTTDREGNSAGYNGSLEFPDSDYTIQLTGTSAAAPLVAAVAAVAKQSQPALNTRFLKHLIARTSEMVDPTDSSLSSGGGWITNGAGLHFNRNYGFGLVNATALIDLLSDFVGVSAQTSANKATTLVNEEIPDNSTVGISRTFVIGSTTPMEDLLIRLNVTHPFRGDVEATVTSPAGTVAMVCSSADDAGSDFDWTFCSNAFWGENPNGTWTITLCDKAEFDVGTWNSYSVTLHMGTLIGADKPQSVTVSPNAIFGGGTSTGRIYLMGPARTGGSVVALSSSSPAAAVPSTVTIPAGATSSTFMISGKSVAAPTVVTISATRLGATASEVITVKPPMPTGLTFSPATVLGGATVTGTVSLNVAAPTGGLPVSLSSDNDAAVVPNEVIIPAGATSTTFSVQTVPVSIRQNCAISAEASGAIKTTVLVVNRAILSTFVLAQSSVLGGTSTTATIAMDGPAPPLGANVLMSSGAPSVIVPERITIPGNQNSRTFTVRTLPVAVNTNVPITALRAGQSKVVVLIVTRAILSTLVVTPSVAGGGQSVLATVTLTGPAPAEGAVVLITDNSAAVTPPESVTILPGQTSASTTIQTSAVTGSTSALLTASYGGLTRNASLTVLPTTVTGFNVAPNPVAGGGTVTCSIQLSIPAGTGGASITLRSSHPGILAVPSSILVPTGSTFKSFQITTSKPSVATTITVTASRSGSSASATVVVNP